jgi:hypothetical protein
MTATTGLMPALLAVQAEAPTLPKDAENPHFRSKYTPLDTIVEVIGPILNRHGLVWTTLPGRDDLGEPALNYRLTHAETGEVLEGTMPLLLVKPDPQGLGSAITYARRYSICAVLNLVADVDDDGNRGSTPQASSSYGKSNAREKPASDKQIALVRRLFTQNGVTQGMAKKLLGGAGVVVADGESARDACSRLQWPGVSDLIETLKNGALSSGEPEMPTPAADDFKHPSIEIEDDPFGAPAPEVPS